MRSLSSSGYCSRCLLLSDEILSGSGSKDYECLISHILNTVTNIVADLCGVRLLICDLNQESIVLEDKWVFHICVCLSSSVCNSLSIREYYLPFVFDGIMMLALLSWIYERVSLLRACRACMLTLACDPLTC